MFGFKKLLTGHILKVQLFEENNVASIILFVRNLSSGAIFVHLSESPGYVYRVWHPIII